MYLSCDGDHYRKNNGLLNFADWNTFENLLILRKTQRLLLGSTVVSPYVGMARKQNRVTCKVLRNIKWRLTYS